MPAVQRISRQDYRAISATPKKRHKYNAKRTWVGDVCFDSAAEAKRYGELLLLFRAGSIRNLELQPCFHFKIGGKRIFTYRADFSYFAGLKRIVEDCKGVKTPVYKIKRKIIEAAYNVRITEVAA